MSSTSTDYSKAKRPQLSPIASGPFTTPDDLAAKQENINTDCPPESAALQSPQTSNSQHIVDKQDPPEPSDIDCRVNLTTDDHIAFWAEHGRWSQDFRRKAMEEVVNPKKRKPASNHPMRENDLLEERNIVLSAERTISVEGLNLFATLLGGEKRPISYPCYPAERFLDVLDRISDLSEERVRRDIGQIVVPSAENLDFSGEPGLETICEEIGCAWTQCSKVGPKQSKPDFTAGLRKSAYDLDIYDKLCYYGSRTTPFNVTPMLSFPFLTAEIKSDDEGGIQRAHRQNLSHGAGAVAAIFKLYWAAYGIEDERSKALYGKPLFFSVSHNHKYIEILAHFALSVPATPTQKQQLKFCHYVVKDYTLTSLDDIDRYGSYNFVFNVYKIFVPTNLERITEAARNLKMEKVLRRSSLITTTETTQDSEASEDVTTMTTQIQLLEDALNRQNEALKQQKAESQQQKEFFENQLKNQNEAMKQQESVSNRQVQLLERLLDQRTTN